MDKNFTILLEEFKRISNKGYIRSVTKSFGSIGLTFEKELNKADFAEVKRKLATLQGWYSSYVRGFIFKYDPTEKLKTG